MTAEERSPATPLPTTSEVDARLASRRAGWFWGTLICGLLGTQVVVGVGAVVIATGDPSASIVPDYYQKALHWDDEMAARASSEALGWELNLAVGGGTDRLGNRTLVVTLTDREGAAIEGADIRGRLFHHARAAESQVVELREHDGGQYTGTAQMARDGLWQVDLSARRPAGGDAAGASEDFVYSQTIELGDAEPDVRPHDGTVRTELHPLHAPEGASSP